MVSYGLAPTILGQGTTRSGIRNNCILFIYESEMTVTIDIPTLVGHLCKQPRETEWLEFKANDAEPTKLGRNISAIANAAAILDRPNGYIVWGIHDETHQIIGTTFDPDKKHVKRDDLDHWLAERLRPSVSFRFHKDRIDGKPVVVLVISSTLHEPVKFDNQGYIRVGSHTRKLCDFPEKERFLWNSSGSRTFERGTAIECAQSDDVLRFLDYESYFALTETPIPVHTLELLHILEHEKFIRSRDDGNWDILNLGCLAFARDLGDSDSLGRKSLRVVRYSGSAKYVKSQQSEFSMGYAAGFARIIDHVNSISPIEETFIGGIRKQEAHIPVASVREVIANALIHQDFVVRGIEPLIEIFDNRIEVVNPGVPLLDKRLFVNAPPESRNEALAKLFPGLEFVNN